MRTEGPLKVESHVSPQCFHVSVFCVFFLLIPPFVFLLDEAVHTKAGRVVTHRGVPMELG